jgi:deoxyadenosine/deoxycytidine kinase
MASNKEIPFRQIAIDGLLRSGKTQLANILAKRIRGRVILDSTENPYLKDFYEEKEGSAFLAQLVFLVNRYHQQSSLLQRSLFDERIICDYIFEKDKIYAYQTLTDDELIVYDKIYSVFAERISRPDLAIYLQISPPVLMRKIAKEGSDLEKSISEKYLADILEAYDYFFFNYQATPLLVVKADNLDFGREEDVEDLIEKMLQMKKDTLYYVPLGKSSKDDLKGK